jgi:nitroreductase
MDASEAIKGRRSIKKYKEEPLFEDQVTQILEAGR